MEMKWKRKEIWSNWFTLNKSRSGHHDVFSFSDLFLSPLFSHHSSSHFYLPPPSIGCKTLLSISFSHSQVKDEGEGKTNIGARIFTKVTITRNGRGKADDSLPLHQLFFSLSLSLLPHHESLMAEKTMRGREEAKQKSVRRKRTPAWNNDSADSVQLIIMTRKMMMKRMGMICSGKKNRMHLNNQGKEMTKKEWTWRNEGERKGRGKWNLMEDSDMKMSEDWQRFKVRERERERKDKRKGKRERLG